MFRCRLVVQLIFVLVVGCSAPPSPDVKRTVPGEGQALLTAYLSSSGSILSSASFTIEKIALYQKGAWLELGIPPVKIDSRESRTEQRLLGVALAPAGEHRRLKLVLKDLAIDGFLLLPEGKVEVVELTLAEPLYLKGKDSQCLFLDWSLGSGRPSDEMRPVFSAAGQRNPLGTGLVYIACQDIDTVYILRSDTNKIVASFTVPGPLGAIQIDQNRRRLYILSPKNRSIYLYDCLKGRLTQQIFLPGTVSPEHFVFDPVRQFAYVADSLSGQVLKVDVASGAVLAQRSVSYSPEEICLIDDGSVRLAVVTPKAQQISILNANDLSVQQSFPVGQQVTDILYQAERLFVVEQASNTVATYQYQTGKLLARIPVGIKPQKLLAVDRGLLYVSNQRSHSLSAIIPGQEISFRKISAGKSPGDLGISRRHQVLYVLSANNRTVSVVDLRSEVLRGTVRTGGSPFAVAVLD